MSDIQTTKALLSRYAIARIPFIAIHTIERNRVLKALKEVFNELDLSLYVHTLSKGICNVSTDRIISDDKTVYGAIDFLTDEMKRRQYLSMVFTETPDLSSDTPDSRQFYDLVNLANESGGMVIVLTNRPIWNQLQRQGMLIKLDLPTESEMYSIIMEYINDYRADIPIEWDDTDVWRAASILTGITRIEAENVIASLIANHKIQKTDLDEIQQQKDRLFSDISGLEKIDVDESHLIVGGLAGLKKWLDEKKSLLTPDNRQRLKSKGLQPPRGILLVGVPGCGKSLSAKSIAANWKLPLYRLDFATVQGSYVGQSEQQLKEALSTAEAVSPCILWIDEIEKGLSGASSANDGGVSTRMVGQFLFWMQECKKQVFVVATANDVSRLPSELLRRGRFDELFFIDLPTADERKDILSLFLNKYLDLTLDTQTIDKIVQVTDGFTGADIESTIRDIAYRQIANPTIALTPDLLITSFNNVVPLSQTSPEKIEDIRNWGKTRAVPASGRPIGMESVPKNKIIHTRGVLL